MGIEVTAKAEENSIRFFPVFSRHRLQLSRIISESS